MIKSKKAKFDILTIFIIILFILIAAVSIWVGAQYILPKSDSSYNIYYINCTNTDVIQNCSLNKVSEFTFVKLVNESILKTEADYVNREFFGGELSYEDWCVEDVGGSYDYVGEGNEIVINCYNFALTEIYTENDNLDELDFNGRKNYITKNIFLIDNDIIIERFL